MITLVSKDIPVNIEESCEKFPKLKWIYETSRLLESQNISYSLYKDKTHTCDLDLINYGKDIEYSELARVNNDGFIIYKKLFIEPLTGNNLYSTAVLVKGEVKSIDSYTKINNVITVNPELNGDIDLKLNALIHLYFSKYTGILCIQSLGKTIIGINLFITEDVIKSHTDEWITKLNRIYNGKSWGK